MIDHISPSMLGLFCKCQEAFRRRYLEREVIPPGIAAIIGTGMHKGAEVNHKQKIDSGADLPLDAIQDAARDGYMKAVKGGVFIPAGEESEAKKDLASGVDTVTNLAASYARQVAPSITPIAAEEKLQAEVPGLPVPLLGILDVLDISGWCPDLKSAGRKWSAGKEEGQLQPAIYTHLLRTVRDISSPTFSFEVISHKGEHQHIPVRTQPEDMAAIITRAQILLCTVQTGLFLPAEPGHWMCSPKWCGYWWSCRHVPAHRKILPNRSNAA